VEQSPVVASPEVTSLEVTSLEVTSLEVTSTARDLARRSQAAVRAKDRAAWLALWAPDAVVADPIGPSPFDPAGTGHRGPAAIAAFYDTVIAPNEQITFEIESSYLCGDEVADVGIIRTVLPGGRHVATVRGVYTYRGNGAGQLAALRAYWEFDQVELTEVQAAQDTDAELAG
jgi:steroid Delta-isomerase